MKVGTDAVLLGAWVDVSKATKILDIGTGCGIIAMMLAQRTSPDVFIDGIDIDEPSVQQANENLLATRWCDRVSFHLRSLQDFTSAHEYDLIVSNPPFFINSQLPPSSHRAKARHTASLSYEELIEHSLRVLAKNGKLAVILPYEEGKKIVSLASMKGLFCNRELSFYSRQGKPQERWLFEFSFSQQLPTAEQLVLLGEADNWSPEYKTLTEAFYLK